MSRADVLLQLVRDRLEPASLQPEEHARALVDAFYELDTHLSRTGEMPSAWQPHWADTGSGPGWTVPRDD